MADFKKNALNKKGVQGFSANIKGVMVIVFATLCLIWMCVSFLGVNNPQSDVLSSTYGLNASANTLNSTLTGITDSINGGSNSSWVNQVTNAGTDPLNFLFLISATFFHLPITIFHVVIGGITSFASVITTIIVTNTGTSPLVALGLTLLIGGLIITFILLVIEFIRIGKS